MKRANVWIIIKAAVAAVILIYLIGMVEPSHMIAVIKNADPLLIFIAVLMSPLNLFWLYRRWKCLIGYVDKEKIITGQDVLGSVLSGATLRLTTPGGLGESGRIFYIREISRMRLLALSIIDGLSSFSTTTIWGLFGLAFITGISWIYWGPFIYAVLVIALLKFKSKIDLSHLTFLHEQFRRPEFWDTIRQIPVSRILTVISMAFAMYLGYAIQYYLFINAFENIPVTEGAAAISSIMLVKTAIPISFGDLGVRESAAIYFLGRYGISNAAALNASLLLFSFNLLLPAIIGSVYIPRFKFRASREAKK